MSNVYLFAMSGLNSAGRGYLHAARTISVDYQKPAPPVPQGYRPAPRDRVEIGGGQGQTRPASYAPSAQSVAAPAGGIEAGVVQLLLAHQAFAANAKMLEAYAKTQQTLVDVAT